MQSVTNTFLGQSQHFDTHAAVPALLVAWAPPGACDVDRVAVHKSVEVGRRADAGLCIQDNRVSSSHLRIALENGKYVVEDLASSNGTFLGGERVIGKPVLNSLDVLRVGRAILVFLADAAEVLAPAPGETFGMAGRFHTRPLIEDLFDATRSARHILLTGPSGTGKELAARALASMYGAEGTPLPIVAHNAARFASDEEASTTIFGVGARIFSGVDGRRGLVEEAEGGVLFLDEVHNLPTRVQRGLLRVIEDGETARIGENTTRPSNVRFVLATNVEDPTRGLAHDLFARLRMVELPSLAQRVADVPDIFQKVLANALAAQEHLGADLEKHLRTAHYEALCRDGFEMDNVRGIVDLADRIASQVGGGVPLAGAIKTVFSKRYAADTPARSSLAPVGANTDHYERNKQQIIDTYQQCSGNLSALERTLKARGLSCSRRWLAIYLGRWGVRD